jgi:hypothetical protein
MGVEGQVRRLLVNIINVLIVVGCAAVATALFMRPTTPSRVLVTAAPAVPVGHDVPTPSPDTAEEALRSLLPPIERESTTLGDALQKLAHFTYAHIEVRWKEIEEQGDGPETKVELNVPPQKSLRDALTQLFQAVDAKHQTLFITDLGFQVEEGEIVVSSVADLYRYSTTVVYNVRDTIDSSVMVDSTDYLPLSRHQALSRLINLIYETANVMPQDQANTLPYRQRISETMGLLVVTLPPFQQDKVAALLQALREASREMPPASRPVVQ